MNLTLNIENINKLFIVFSNLDNENINSDYDSTTLAYYLVVDLFLKLGVDLMPR